MTLQKFVYLLFYMYVSLKNFSLIWRRHHYRWRAANLGLCLALMAFEQRGITCCDTEPRFIRSHPKDRRLDASYDKQWDVDWIITGRYRSWRAIRSCTAPWGDPHACRNKRLNRVRWDRKIRGPVSQQVCPSPAVVTSPYKWNIVEWDVTQYIINQNLHWVVILPNPWIFPHCHLHLLVLCCCVRYKCCDFLIWSLE
jgi:hypothetical protein